MQSTFAVTGTLEDGGLVRLDEPIPLASGKVRLIVESVDTSPAMTSDTFEEMSRERQRVRGHQPRSTEELDAYLNDQAEHLLNEATDYPVADFYEPASYDWTAEGYEVRQALKRYSEESHADH